MNSVGETPSILLLGNYRPALTLARTLKKRGYEVIVGTEGYEDACQHSNAVSRIWQHKPIKLSPELFLEELNKYCKNNANIEAVYLVAEEYVRIFSENEEYLVGAPKIVTVAAETVRKCLNKPFMMRLAEELDVPTAAFAEVSNSKQLWDAVASIGYPLIIRPEDSTCRFEGKKALTVGNDDLLHEIIVKHKISNQKLLLQKKFKGKRHNVYFAAIGGKMIRRLHAVIDRTDAPDGTGLAVEGHTIETTGPLIEQTTRLVSSLRYSGIGCAQFLVCEDSGASSFLEINPRIAGNHALPEYAGLDLGNFMLDLALGKLSNPSPVEGPAGIRFAWITGDIDGFKTAYLRGDIGVAGLMWCCWRAFSCALKAHVHMVYAPSDPMPALYKLWQSVPRLDRWRKPTTERLDHGAFNKNGGAKT